MVYEAGSQAEMKKLGAHQENTEKLVPQDTSICCGSMWITAVQQAVFKVMYETQVLVSAQSADLLEV